MKTMSILLKKSSLEISYISQKSCEYIHDYIDYLLYPYRQLGCFKFNSFIDCGNPIDGKNSPTKLLTILKENIQIHDEIPLNLYFCKNNIFLNGESLNFYISVDDYCIIEEKVNEYFIFYTHLHN